MRCGSQDRRIDWPVRELNARDLGCVAWLPATRFRTLLRGACSAPPRGGELGCIEPCGRESVHDLGLDVPLDLLVGLVAMGWGVEAIVVEGERIDCSVEMVAHRTEIVIVGRQRGIAIVLWVHQKGIEIVTAPVGHQTVIETGVVGRQRGIATEAAAHQRGIATGPAAHQRAIAIAPAGRQRAIATGPAGRRKDFATARPAHQTGIAIAAVAHRRAIAKTQQQTEVVIAGLRTRAVIARIRTGIATVVVAVAWRRNRTTL